MDRSLIAVILIAINTLSEAKTPNILLIVSEDNGPEIGSYGTEIETPNLDELKLQGLSLKMPMFLRQAAHNLEQLF